MKTKISQFDDNIGKDIEGYYFLSDFKISSGKKGRYANVFITDCTGSHTARMWQETISEDGSREAALIGKVIHVYGRVDAYDGKGSLIIGAMNEAAEAEYEMSEIARCLSKEYLKGFTREIGNYMLQISDENLALLVKTIFNENYAALSQLPAGLKMHHNFNGGLLIHTCEVCELAVDYLNLSERMKAVKEYGPVIDSRTKDLVIAGALLHDIGKVYEYRGFPSARITKKGELLGHLDIGADIIRSTAKKTGMTDEDMIDELCHIVLSSDGDESCIAPKTFEALIVSFADNFSAQCDNYGVLLSEDKRICPDDPGDFFYSKIKQRKFLRKE